jgi:hypothetical protein
MKLGLRDIDWQQVGAQLAQSSDNEQITFFKAFVKECNSWGTSHQVELQLAVVMGGLTKKERETLAMLGYNEDELIDF